MAGLTKQAAYLDEKSVKKVFAVASEGQNARRDTLILMLGLYAGLRSKEIAGLRWENVLTQDGEIDQVIRLTNDISKGKTGGYISINNRLRGALIDYLSAYKRGMKNKKFDRKQPVIQSSRGSGGMKAQSVVVHLKSLFTKAGLDGASSHSLRRTFITNCARAISSVGGSMKDVQELARHANLQNTQLYVASNSEASRKVVELI